MTRRLLAGCCTLLLLTPLAWPVPLDDEFQVNSTTANEQRDPDVAMDDDGNFVVVFHNWIPVNGADVGAQRYNAAGVPQGAEFKVNNTNGNDNSFPRVAMDADGDFAVVWRDSNPGQNIHYRVYRNDGVALTPGAGVTTTTSDLQRRPDVAMDANGDFVVVWEHDPNGAKRDIRGQRYNAAGATQGNEFIVSTNAAIDNVFPQVAMAANGDFIVAWAAGDVGANQDVVFRRYDASGTAQGGAVQVNVTSKMDHASGTVNNLSIATDAAGNFVIAWNANEVDLANRDLNGIRARHYDSQGVPSDDYFLVNNTMRPTDAPEVAMADDGSFAISFDAPDGSLMGPWLQRFKSEGVRAGPAMPLNNVTTTLRQTDSDVAIANDGDGVVVWGEQGADADGDQDGVFARLFTGVTLTTHADFNQDFRGDQLFRSAQQGRNHLWQLHGPVVLSKLDIDSLGGAKWRVVGTSDFDRDGNADILWRNTNSGLNRLWLMSGAEIIAKRVVPAIGANWHVAGVGDADGDGKADIFWRHAITGQVRLWLMTAQKRRAIGTLGSLNPVHEIVAVDDFSGDGKADLLFRNANNGQNRIWRVNRFSTTKRTIAGLGTNWRVAGSGDVNRDGFADILWRDPVTGANRIWQMRTFTVQINRGIRQKPSAWEAVGMRDTSGDARADILWQNQATGTMHLWRMNRFNVTASGLGRPDAGLVAVPN